MYLFYFSMLATMAFLACLVLSGLGVMFVGICEAFIGVCFVDVFLAVSLFLSLYYCHILPTINLFARMFVCVCILFLFSLLGRTRC